MGGFSPFIFRDGAGVIRLVGYALGGGGGGGQQQVFAGDPVLIADGDSAPLTWDNPAGDALLDLTDPANPVVIASGVYALTAQIGLSGAMTVGGHYHVASNGPIITYQADSMPAAAGFTFPTVGVCWVQKCTLGDVLSVYVFNSDGVQAIPFGLSSALLIKLS